MNEKLAKKLEKLLAKAGLDEDKIDEILSEVEEASAEESAPDGDNPDENQVPPSDENGANEPTEEGAGDVPPEGELPIPPEPQGDVPPEGDVPTQEGDGSIGDALAQLAAQEGDVVPPQPEGEVPPTPDQAPAAPQFDPTVIEQLTSQLGEANKTIEALKTQVDSLYEALREAGVISGESKLGDETPRVTESASTDASADAFDDILSVINGK